MKYRSKKKHDKIVKNNLYSFLEKISKVKGICCLSYGDIIYITLSARPRIIQPRAEYYADANVLFSPFEARLQMEPLLLMTIDTSALNIHTDWPLIIKAFQDIARLYILDEKDLKYIKTLN